MGIKAFLFSQSRFLENTGEVQYDNSQSLWFSTRCLSGHIINHICSKLWICCYSSNFNCFRDKRTVCNFLGLRFKTENDCRFQWLFLTYHIHLHLQELHLNEWMQLYAVSRCAAKPHICDIYACAFSQQKSFSRD